MPIDQDAKQRIILTASLLAGPDADTNQVKAQVERLAGYLSDGSNLMGVFERLEKRDENTTDVFTFPATVIGVDKEVRTYNETTGQVNPEKGSTRALVFLRSFSKRENQIIQQVIRTDRTDDEAGRAFAKRCVDLIGHKVIVTRAVERTGKGTSSSTIRDIQDKGLDPEYTQPDGSVTAEFVPDYGILKANERFRLATQSYPGQQAALQPA